jgi:hypothetical protein
MDGPKEVPVPAVSTGRSSRAQVPRPEAVVDMVRMMDRRQHDAQESSTVRAGVNIEIRAICE